jgi:hypothetical protein
VSLEKEALSVAENTPPDQSVAPSILDLAESYAYRLGRAVARLQALVDPPAWANDEDIERSKDLAREFLAEDAEREARAKDRRRTLLAGGGGR